MPFANGKECRLYWRSNGRDDAPVLLLLNSLGTDMGMWDSIIPLLHDSFRIIRMDTRGHGASDVTDGDYTIDNLGADVLAVLDAAGAEHASVCGLSLGGMIAMHIALSAPDRISKLIACNTSAQVPAQPWLDRAALVRREGMTAIVNAVMERFFSDAFRADAPPALATVCSAFLSTSPQGYAACCSAISSVDLIDQLPSVNQPTLVINGALDTATPPQDHGNRIITAIPGANAATLNAGHISAVEQPIAFAAAITEFLHASPVARSDGNK